VIAIASNPFVRAIPTVILKGSTDLFISFFFVTTYK
jgi:hypothetical protein